MSDGVPFKSRHGLQWQIVLVDPRLLRAAQRQLRASGPSHAIEEALRLALQIRRQTAPIKRRPATQIH
ncbi:MAG: hypothetical protein H7099_12580 [Gemmatimonadaceae bacterium]|nr:hypothetical protein [Gemmatimonadaceae bacterium]